MKIPFGKLGVVAVFAIASISPAAATADNGHGNGHTPKTSPSKPKTHNVTYVFKGTWNADGSVMVNHGNRRVRKGGFIGQNVTFDFSTARIVVKDTNNDGSKTTDDVTVGDKVVVKCRLPRTDPGAQPFKAKMLIDQSRRPH
jgi:hypothetical protein